MCVCVRVHTLAYIQLACSEKLHMFIDRKMPSQLEADYVRYETSSKLTTCNHNIASSSTLLVAGEKYTIHYSQDTRITSSENNSKPQRLLRIVDALPSSRCGHIHGDLCTQFVTGGIETTMSRSVGE